MSEAIFVEGLTKTYGEKTVVNHLNFSVKRGTVFGLLGANGAGKSTTIECILGTKKADEGTVRLLGQDPKKQRRSLFERVGVQCRTRIIQTLQKRRYLCAFLQILGWCTYSTTVLAFATNHQKYRRFCCMQV